MRYCKIDSNFRDLAWRTHKQNSADHVEVEVEVRVGKKYPTATEESKMSIRRYNLFK